MVIFDQWPKFSSGMNVRTEIQILKGIVCIAGVNQSSLSKLFLLQNFVNINGTKRRRKYVSSFNQRQSSLMGEVEIWAGMTPLEGPGGQKLNNFFILSFAVKQRIGLKKTVEFFELLCTNL